MKTLRLNTPARRAYAKRLIDAANDDDLARIGKETRSEEQNRKMWPMLADLRDQVEWLNGYTTDDIKLMFLNKLGVELRFLPTLERQGMFPVGLKSSTLTKEQFTGLIELIYQLGAEEGVTWSDPVERKAKAIEARRTAAENTDAVHESAVPKGFAQLQSDEGGE